MRSINNTKLIKNKIASAIIRTITYFLLSTYTIFNIPAIPQTTSIIEYKLNVNQYSFSEIVNKVDNKTKKLIKNLVLEDKANDFTEFAGLITLNNNKLDFYVITTSNERIAITLDSYKDDWGKVYNYLKRRKNYFYEIISPSPFNLDSLINAFERKDLSEEKKNGLANNFINNYIFHSNNRSDHNYLNMVFYYYTNLKLKGEYVGDFHIHDNGENISIEDIKSSNVLRQIVIIGREDGFDLVDIARGSVQRAEFKY